MTTDLGEPKLPPRTVLSLYRGLMTVGPPQPVVPTIATIQTIVAAYYGLSRLELISDRRSRDVARPRQVAMWIAKKITTRSLPDIGRRFGGRDHTTVLHAIRRIEELRAEDPEIENACTRLLERLERPLT
jgi:chromosomal replication initiator protein